MFVISRRLGDKEHWRSRDLEIVVVDFVMVGGGVKMQILSDCLPLGIYVAIGSPDHSGMKKNVGGTFLWSPPEAFKG